jgi:LPXTG-site transpeptidase (sortase) family protein
MRGITNKRASTPVKAIASKPKKVQKANDTSTKVSKLPNTSDTPKKPKKPFKKTFLPAIAGILTTLIILVALNFQIIEAQWRYQFAAKNNVATASSLAATTASNTTNDDTKSPNPEKGPLLTIPAISAEAPIVFEPSFAEWKVQIALRSGVVHYGTTANPGENGNIVILGHSSGQAWAPGSYKFVFTLLNKLQKDDLIYLDYNGIRYTYKVTDSVVVAPTDTTQIQPTSTPTLSLVTCTPVGTSTNRLVVHATQISPSPTKAATTPATTTTTVPAIPQELPGSENVSLWHRFLNLF